MIARGAALFLALAAQASPAPDYVTPDGRYRLVGYNDMDQMLEAAAARIAASGSATRYVLDLKSTRSAPAALIAGTSLLAPMGAALSPDERAAFRAAWGSDPVEFRIAHDSLTPGTLSSPSAILVASGNPLRRISMTQVRRLFTGEHQAPTWGDLGLRGAWAKRPVRLVSLAGDTAIGQFALNGPLRAARFADRVEPLRQSRDVAAAIAADNAAIGLANANFASGAVRALPLVAGSGKAVAPTPAGIRSGRYPFDRFLLIYARVERGGKLAPAAAELLESLLSARGQDAIAQESRGYLPLNSAELAVERQKLRKIQYNQ